MYIATTHSTSSLIREQYMDREDGFYIVTDNQTAGRGQVGNHWESEPGQNLTFSILLHRDWPIAHAWDINIGVALAITDVIGGRIKWPNDIYIGDRKVCGTLIENFVSGGVIASSIVGIGLNVNQQVFLSDAPNPTSLMLEDGIHRDLRPLLQAILDRIPYRLAHPDREQYMSLLYRNDGGIYQWEAGGERFLARVAGVSPMGELLLEREDKKICSYLQKQVKHIL